MSSYLCHKCASSNGMLNSLPNLTELTDNKYKLDKFIKHTVPSSCSDYKTVFTGVGSDSYLDAVVNGYVSGGVEIDDSNRTNIVWVGSESNGMAYVDGHVTGITHGVKVALPHDQNKLHAFPVEVGQLRSEVCSVCGGLVVL